jgi:hypothetical protein
MRQIRSLQVLETVNLMAGGMSVYLLIYPSIHIYINLSISVNIYITYQYLPIHPQPFSNVTPVTGSKSLFTQLASFLHLQV